ncbi:MAG TPA: hypothetical protein VLL97_05105 [Acidobacteriota bacterium]|nr:hypothetical protein [Acidobacteriota bacterium]
MLLSSILHILGRHEQQPGTAGKKKADPFKIGGAGEDDGRPELKIFHKESPVAAEFQRSPQPYPGTPPPTVGELIRTVSKFEQQDRKRMIDVFE